MTFKKVKPLSNRLCHLPVQHQFSRSISTRILFHVFKLDGLSFFIRLNVCCFLVLCHTIFRSSCCFLLVFETLVDIVSKLTISRMIFREMPNFIDFLHLISQLHHFLQLWCAPSLNHASFVFSVSTNLCSFQPRFFHLLLHTFSTQGKHDFVIDHFCAARSFTLAIPK